MYTFTINTGVVVRDADGVQVAPVDDPTDAGHVEYQAWLDAGNEPTIAIATLPSDKPRVISRLDFRRLFSFAERVGIDASADPVVRTFLTDLSMAQDVSLDHPDVLAGLGYLEQAGHIAAGRAAEIRA